MTLKVVAKILNIEEKDELSFDQIQFDTFVQNYQHTV